MASLTDLIKLYNESKFEDVIREAEKITEKDLDIEVIKARSYRKLGKYKEGLAVLEQLNFIPEDSTESKVNFYTIELDILTHMGNYEEGKKLIKPIKDLLNEIDVKSLEKKDKHAIAQTYNELGRLSFFLSEYYTAIEYLEQELEIAREIGDKERISSAIQNIGSTYTSLGQYVKANEYFTEAMEIAKQLKSKHLIGHIADNIALVYFIQGKLDEALDQLELSIEKNEEVKDIRGLGFNYEYMGSIKLKQGFIPEALVDFEKSLEIRKSLGNDTHTSSILFAIVCAFMDLDEREHAKHYLDELESVTKRTPTKRTEMLLELANAVFLKGSTRFRNKATAEQLLKSVISNPDKADFSYTIIAYLHLIDLLYEQIQELELSENDYQASDVEGLFAEIEQYAEAIGEIAIDKDLPDLKVSYYNIKGFIFLSKFDMENAYSYFDMAETVCRTYDLENVQFKFKDIQVDDKFKQEAKLVMNKEAFSHKIQKSLNKIIHSLPRLLIITSLLKNVELTFTELREKTNLSAGNLGKHCDKLEESGYISKQKSFIDDRFLTVYALTTDGMAEFNRYKDILIPFLTSVE